MKQLFFALLMCSAAIGNLCAQQEKQISSPADPAIFDKEFIIQAHQSGLVEVMFGNLAQMQGKSEIVQDYGKMMESDHNKANKEIMNLADKNNISLTTNTRNGSEPIRGNENKIRN